MMKDGTELELETGGQEYDKLSDGTVVTQKSWPVPVDLSQAKALRYRQEGKDYILELK